MPAKKGDWVLIAVASSYTSSGFKRSDYVNWRVAKAAVVRNGLVMKVDTGGRKPEPVAGELRTITSPTAEQARRLAVAMDKPVYFTSLDVAKHALTDHNESAIDDAKVFATLYSDDVGTNPKRTRSRKPELVELREWAVFAHPEALRAIRYSVNEEAEREMWLGLWEKAGSPDIATYVAAAVGVIR